MKLLNPIQMGEELVRDVVQCAPDERVRIARGYARHVEAYGEATATEYLEQFSRILHSQSLKESKRILAAVIRELKGAVDANRT